MQKGRFNNTQDNIQDNTQDNNGPVRSQSCLIH
jgi:hypothetical protein